MNMTEVVSNLDGVTVTITQSSGLDNAMVVFIDTEFEPNGSDGRGLRVWVNDDTAYVGVDRIHDPTEDMSEDELEAHNEAMSDPQYRDAMYQERN